MNKTLISMLVCGFAVSMAFGDWPVLRTYEGECLRRVRMPMGGIGTGTVSLSGRGSLVDWETLNRPAKGRIPSSVEKCRKPADDDGFNPMRGFALKGEESLRMAWYPAGQMPKSPFPYYTETMTGFEYVVATLQVLYGDRAGAERTVRNVRSRYDGVKRNPFDEAECGHHYARALAAWSVLKAWNVRSEKEKR